MDLENYKVTNYSIFENAANTNNNMANNVEEQADKIINDTDVLYDANIFDGPIANICQEEILNIGQKLFLMRDKFTPISSALESFSQRYQQADKDAENIVSSVS